MKPCCRPSVPYGAVAQSNIIIRFQGAWYAWRSMSTHVNTLHAIACLTACEVSDSIHCYSVQRFNRIKLILRSKCLALAGSCEEMAGSFEQADCRRLPVAASVQYQQLDWTNTLDLALLVQCIQYSDSASGVIGNGPAPSEIKAYISS